MESIHFKLKQTSYIKNYGSKASTISFSFRSILNSEAAAVRQNQEVEGANQQEERVGTQKVEQEGREQKQAKIPSAAGRHPREVLALP